MKLPSTITDLRRYGVAFALYALGLMACQSDSGPGQQPAQPDGRVILTPDAASVDTKPVVVDKQAPTVGVSGLAAYAGVKGTVNLQATVTDNGLIAKVELLVNQTIVETKAAAPYSFAWDTTKSNDGPVDVTVRATDDAGNVTNQATRVIILNAGVEVPLVERGAGTMTIPPNFNGTQETDVKQHFVPSQVFQRAVAVCLWQNPVGGTIWDLEVEMGTGFCPDDGKSFGKTNASNTGAVELDVMPTAGLTKGVTHFFHAKARNAALHKGEKLGYKMAVFLFGPKEALDTCPLNSGYPCRCDNVKTCNDGSMCVAFQPDKTGGACAPPCKGEADTTSCAATTKFGLFGFCGGYKGNDKAASYCVLVCGDNGKQAECPPGFSCTADTEVCMPTY